MLTRAGVHASPDRVAAVYLELAVLVRALAGPLRRGAPRRAARRAPRSGPACSTCARPCSARPWTTCARLPPSITVVGSVNLDLVARVERLPRPGETVTDATFARVPGGKGANQAVAAPGSAPT